MPQAAACSLRIFLKKVQVAVAFGIAVIHPGHACANHVLPCILLLAAHVGHRAVVSVDVGQADGGLLPVAQIGQCLSGCTAKGLVFLGRVDGGDTYGHLPVCVWLIAACDQGVTVKDADDEAKQGGCKHGKEVS